MIRAIKLKGPFGNAAFLARSRARSERDAGEGEQEGADPEEHRQRRTQGGTATAMPVLSPKKAQTGGTPATPEAGLAAALPRFPLILVTCRHATRFGLDTIHTERCDAIAPGASATAVIWAPNKNFFEFLFHRTYRASGRIPRLDLVHGKGIDLGPGFIRRLRWLSEGGSWRSLRVFLGSQLRKPGQGIVAFGVDPVPGSAYRSRADSGIHTASSDAALSCGRRLRRRRIEARLFEMRLFHGGTLFAASYRADHLAECQSSPWRCPRQALHPVMTAVQARLAEPARSSPGKPGPRLLLPCGFPPRSTACRSFVRSIASSTTGERNRPVPCSVAESCLARDHSALRRAPCLGTGAASPPGGNVWVSAGSDMTGSGTAGAIRVGKAGASGGVCTIWLRRRFSEPARPRPERWKCGFELPFHIRKQRLLQDREPNLRLPEILQSPAMAPAGVPRLLPSLHPIRKRAAAAGQRRRLPSQEPRRAPP